MMNTVFYNYFLACNVNLVFDSEIYKDLKSVIEFFLHFDVLQKRCHRLAILTCFQSLLFYYFGNE